jgi:hypothetical protein
MKEHPSFKNYLIGENGDVISKITHKKNKKMKPSVLTTGYQIICLRENGKSRHVLHHRLVLETYHPISNSHLYQCHHKNHIRNDNRLENLEWVLVADHVSKHHKGRVASEETRRKMSEASKGNQNNVGKLWWNNGTKTIRRKECPGSGWVRGRL